MDAATGGAEEDTAAQWARRRGRQWVARRVDVVRGFMQRLDFTEIILRVLLCALLVYAVYLAWCESCKNEYWEFAKALGRAAVDFFSPHLST